VSLAADEELVRRIAGGDRGAFAELYDRHVSTLLAVAHRVLRSAGEAEDLVHDVCLEAWRQAHTYDPGRGTVRAWLVMRTRSRALDRLKGARLRVDAGEPADLAAVEADPTVGPDSLRVRRALGGLHQEHRTVLDLAYFEGLSLSEIGERLAIPIGTAKSRLARALAKLREELRVDAGGAA
jgi:RNA polymerase sigma-70 factor (ECF subfamily)